MSKKKFFVFSIIFSSILCFSGSSIVAAKDASVSTQGLEISPTLFELSADKGRVYNVTIKLRNLTSSTVNYYLNVNDFNATDETGSPHVVFDSKLPATASIISWVSAPAQLKLESMKSGQITAKITIPNNAEPGGHYGVISFSEASPEVEGSGV